MTFIVLEGFSGTGKTTLAVALEERGWLRLPESAHVLPESVPVAGRADTFSDYSLFGTTMGFCSEISRSRRTRNIVSEGYFLGDLSYAKVRYEMRKSEAYPDLLSLCRSMLKDERLKPDLYLRLVADGDTIGRRQAHKGDRERNQDEFFRERYYSAIEEIHATLGESKVERIPTDTDPASTFKQVEAALRRRGLWPQ